MLSSCPSLRLTCSPAMPRGPSDSWSALAAPRSLLELAQLADLGLGIFGTDDELVEALSFEVYPYTSRVVVMDDSERLHAVVPTREGTDGEPAGPAGADDFHPRDRVHSIVDDLDGPHRRYRHANVAMGRLDFFKGAQRYYELVTLPRQLRQPNRPFSIIRTQKC